MKTKRLVTLALLSALAFALYYVEVPTVFLFPTAPFLKIDFSALPSLVAAIGIGPFAGIAVEFIKNILHAVFITKEPALSGEIANFLYGAALILPVALMMRKNKKLEIPGYIIGLISSVAVMSLANYFITLPLYGISEHAVKMDMLIHIFAPFNALKGLAVAAVSFLLFRSKVFDKVHIT